MRLASCYFEVAAGGKWGRLARVLETSAREHLPGWQLTVERLPLVVAADDANERTAIANSAKLAWWVDQVLAACDGDELLLIDADTLILRPLDDIWRQAFDVAYTVKPAGLRFPFNAGVVFLRVSPAVRAFAAAWLGVNDRMLADRRLHEQYKYRYGGINQAALGYLLKHEPPAVDLRALACLEWNCEDETAPAFDPTLTRILHIKGPLRLACFHRFARTPDLAELVRRWLDVERRAVATQDRTA